MVASTPIGAAALWLLVVGFAGLTLWRLSEAVYGGPGPDGRKASTRAAAAFRVAVYGFLAFSLLKFALGLGAPPSSDKTSRDLTAAAMSHPGGVAVVGLAGVALLGGIAFEISRRERMGGASFSPRWLLRAWRPLAAVPIGVVLVSAEAIRQLRHPRSVRGQFRAVSFRCYEGERDEGRHAIAEAFGSLAPNTIVIGVDSETELLLVHQLRRRGGREELDVLELG